MHLWTISCGATLSETSYAKYFAHVVLFRLCKCCWWKLNLSHLFSFHFFLSIRQFNDWSLETKFCQIEIEIELFTGPINNDFVTNSYGESWDSSCEKYWVPVQNQWVPVKKKTPKLKMLRPFAWACNHTVLRQTQKLCITVHLN